MSAQLPLETVTEVLFKGCGNLSLIKQFLLLPRNILPRNTLPRLVQYKFSLVYPFRYHNNVVILQPGTSIASDTCPNDIHGLPYGGCDVRNSSKSFALWWWVFCSEVAKLKSLCFYHALLYILKKNNNHKSSNNRVCVTYNAK